MPTGEYDTIDQIKAANRAHGGYFFSPNTMRTWRSRVLDGVIGGRYFITSEARESYGRRYTVRECLPSGDCRTVRELDFASFSTPAAARKAAWALADTPTEPDDDE